MEQKELAQHSILEPIALYPQLVLSEGCFKPSSRINEQFPRSGELLKPPAAVAVFDGRLTAPTHAPQRMLTWRNIGGLVYQCN